MKKKLTKQERKSKYSLTILFACVILVFIVVTLVAATLVGYLLVRLNIISVANGTNLSFGKTILLLCVTSLILGAALSAFAARYPLKPVLKIIGKMRQLASGDFKARLEFEGPLAKHPTTKEICTSFNKMAAELESTELLRSDFINNFSHEFKTPIVSIAGFAKLLKRGDLSEAQKAEYITVIEEESRRLAAMANNVLNLTKIENRTILTDITQFNLSEQIRFSFLSLEGKWDKKQISFDLSFPEYVISGNEEMLKHVWINLIDNAIKFSEVGAPVRVDIQEDGEHYIVSVTNYGPDIPEDKLERIFQKFYQVDESHTAEGNGIGLALVKSVTQLHGGQVAVASREGVTTFTVTLPKDQPGR